MNSHYLRDSDSQEHIYELEADSSYIDDPNLVRLAPAQGFGMEPHRGLALAKHGRGYMPIQPQV